MKKLCYFFAVLILFACDNSSDSSDNSCVSESKKLVGVWSGKTLYHQVNFSYPNNYDTVDYDVELTLTVSSVIGLAGDGDEADLRNPTTRLVATLSGVINGSTQEAIDYEATYFCNENEFNIFDNDSYTFALNGIVNSSFNQMEVNTGEGFPFIEPKSNSSGNKFSITLEKK